MIGGARRKQPFVIVGAGLAGATASLALRREGFDGGVVLIGAEPDPPYERPPLSKSYLRGETSFEDALVRPSRAYADLGIDLMLSTEAGAIDPGRKTVTLVGGGDVAYERLLIATGARNRRVALPGVGLEGVFDLRTRADSERLRSAAVDGADVVVGGMSFIGSEVAASLRQIGVGVTAVSSDASPLGRQLGAPVANVLAEIHHEHGVRLVGGDRVRALEGAGRVEAVVTQAGRRLVGDAALLAMGVEPAAELAASASIEVGDGIVVDGELRTNARDVFACGDVANGFNRRLGQSVRIEHWENARRQGIAAARSMLGKGAPYDEVPWFWSEQYDHELEYAGHHRGWDELIVRGSPADRSFLAFYLQSSRVKAVVSLNRGPDLRRAMPLIAAPRAVDPTRLADEDVDLGALASS